MNDRDRNGDPPRWKTAVDAPSGVTRWLQQAFREAGGLPHRDLTRLERSWRRASLTPIPRRQRLATWALVVGAFILGSVTTSLAALGAGRGVWRALAQIRDRGAPAVAARSAPTARGRWRIKAKGAGEIQVALSAPSGDELVVLAGPADRAVPEAEASGKANQTKPSPAAPLRPAVATSPNVSFDPSFDPAMRTAGGEQVRGRGPAASSEKPSVAVVAASRALTAPPRQPKELPRAPAARPLLALPLRAPRWGTEPIGHEKEVTASPASTAQREPIIPPAAAEVLRQSSTATPMSEGRMLAEALRHLRREGEPRTALRDLELYRSYYSTGRLAGEEMLIRAEAWFRAGDRTRALAVLDAVPLDLSGRRGLELVRGELRAEQKRCADAMRDFAQVMQLGRPDDLTERALYGQGACRAQMGDIVRARADLETYLRLFPNSPHRADAERFLAESALADVRN